MLNQGQSADSTMQGDTSRADRGHFVLRDVHQTFLDRLFGKYSKESDRLCGERLLGRLRDEFNNDPNRFRTSLGKFWINCNERAVDADAVLKGLVSLCEQAGRLVDDEVTNKLLVNLFGKLVGFSLMKVDRVYRQIYYVDIYHHLLAKKIRDMIKQAVLVPFNQGSVGFAARIGGLSLSNSLNDPRGTVASEDLLQGNISIMMSGIGRQVLGKRTPGLETGAHDKEGVNPSIDYSLSDFQLDEPEQRWRFSNETADWEDTMVMDEEQCAAILFCYFPIHEIFPNYLSTSSVGIRGESEQDSDPPALYKLFTEITRTYEHSLLADIYKAQAKFVTKRTDEAIKRKINTLDVLASLQTTDNPTGGLLALRSDLRDCRICVPKLEASLARPVFEHDEVQQKLLEQSPKHQASHRDPVLLLFTQNIVSIKLGSTLDGQSLVTLLLHCRGASNKEATISLDIDISNIPTICSFFSLIRKRYYAQFESLFAGKPKTGRVEQQNTFGMVKVAVDAYEGVAAYIARIVCSGIEETMRLPFFAALPKEATSRDGFNPEIERKDQVSALSNVIARLIEQTFQEGGNPISSIDALGAELEYIDAQSARIRDRIVGVSAYYWAAHQIEPLEPDSPVKALNEFGEEVSSRVNSAWKAEGPAVRRLLRMLCLKSMLDDGPIYIAYPVGNKRTSAQFQFVIPVPESLKSRYGLSFRFEPSHPPSDNGQPKILSFCFVTRQGTNDVDVARTLWSVKPKYRMAALCLNRTNIDASLRDSIVSWDQGSLDSDELICSMSKYLNAKRVNLRDMADESRPDLFDDWRVSFYTIGGRWTKLGRQLVTRIKNYEEHLQATEEFFEEKGRADTAEALVGGTSHSLKIPFQVAKDLAEKGLAKEAARILKIGVSFVTVGAYVQNYRREQRKKVAQLRDAYLSLKPTAFDQADNETWISYGKHLEENLYRLSDRLAHGTYLSKLPPPNPTECHENQCGDLALERRIVQHVIQGSDALLSDEFLVNFAPARDRENPDALLLEESAVEEWLDLAAYYVKLRDGGEIIKRAEAQNSSGLWLDWNLPQSYILKHANQTIFSHDTEAGVFLSAFTEIVANAIANARPQNRRVTVSFSTLSDKNLIVRVVNNLRGKPPWSSVREYEEFAARHSGVVGAFTVKWACESLGWTFDVRSFERDSDWFQEVEFAADVLPA